VKVCEGSMMIRSAVLTQITGVTSNSDGPDFDGLGFDGSPVFKYTINAL